MSQKHLVIVESPAKSKTIKKYLGNDFEVKASFGHIADLPTKELGVDIENNFKPKYVINPDKKKVVKELKELAQKAQKVRIATDEDREGEAIGRHVCNALGLDLKTTPRIVFHEITKPAITNAIKNPRIIDMNLVDAQQARRILDRLVGFKLSPVLWKKIKTGLSAGRVQSVAVRLIVEREREIQDFNSTFEFKITGNFENQKGEKFIANLNKTFKKKEKVVEFLETLKDKKFKIEKIEKKPGKKSPTAPFTTSTLQQEASRKLGFPVAKTMQIAQKLYEQGLITYMRTDSVNISDVAIKQAQEEIIKQYGKKYSNPTKYKSKTKGAQEAHECIRPTDFSKHTAGTDSSQQKLYQLIRKRAIASQMAKAQIEKTKVTIDFDDNKKKFIAEGEVIIFDGFLKVYVESTNEDGNEENTKNQLPQLKEGEIIKYETINAIQNFKKHPPRYTEASLVKELEKKGIGRPSTYATIISTIQKRGYVVKENRQGEEKEITEIKLKNGKITETSKTKKIGSEKQKLFPTDIGMIVNDFLVKHFPEIMDYDFTAHVEEQFDIIAKGELQRQQMIKHFYENFAPKVEQTTTSAQRESGEKILGKDPKSGKTILCRIGRYGPVIQLGKKEELKEGEKIKYANLPKGKNIETITLEEALKCFELPRKLGKYENLQIEANIGRYGPYIKWGNSFISIPEEFDVYEINLEQAIELIKQKKETDKNKNIAKYDLDGNKIQVLNGRYGPYIKYKNKNYRIPKQYKENLSNITLEDCKKILGIK